MTDETATPATPEPTTVTSPPDPAPAQGAGPRRAVSSADTTPPRRPDYRGEELDPERGPGLGCFWFQVIVLGFFIVLIPIGLELSWPFELLAFLLFVVIGLLLLTGQSVIFLLRLVAADRRAQGRRRPLASPTKTVGELEDEQQVETVAERITVPTEPAGHDEPGDAPAAEAEAERAADDSTADEPVVAAEPPPDATGTGPADSGPAGAPVPDADAALDRDEGPPAPDGDTVPRDGTPAPGDDPGARPPDLPPNLPPELPPDAGPPEEPDPGVRQ